MDDISVAAMSQTATILFALAVLHTFLVKQVNQLAHHFRPGSVMENLLHFLGEVEVVFGLWASVFVGIWIFKFGSASAVSFLESVNFTEPAFVFAIMCMAATRPVMWLARSVIQRIAGLLPFQRAMSRYLTTLIVGPLLGSLITEPAAMTVTALLLKQYVFDQPVSLRFKYATIGLLFVAVSIGGTLTHFAAPPVLMVAGPWGWDTKFMLINFGEKAALSIFIGVIATAMLFRKEFEKMAEPAQEGLAAGQMEMKFWVAASHLFFMALTIVHSHHMSFFIPVFLLFIGWTDVTKEYQDGLKVRESLLVAYFLGGLVTLGKLQSWWLQPLLEGTPDLPLFIGAISLTAITDNAALTYLGTLVPTLTDSAKYALVSGAVIGGGLTVIANAPNPAGYGILRESFGKDGISPGGLFLGALPHTLLAALIFWIWR
jgi:hypothetical protein